MARRLELLAKIAEVQEEKMGLKTLAFNTLIRMFHEDLSNKDLREKLERVAAEDDNLEALAAVYEEELDNVEEPETGAAIALKVAQVQEKELLDDDEAIRFYRTVLRFDARHLEALQALDRLYEKQERTDDLMDILSREVELVEEPEEQVQILFRLGKGLYEKLEQPAKAVGYFRKVLELEPAHVDSMKMLERLFAELGDHESLYGVLMTRLEQTEGLEDRTEMVARIADLAANQMGKPDEAIDQWNNILAEDERNEDAYDALDRLYETTERWADLAGIIETRMQRTVDPERIATLSSRLAWVKGEKLGELEDAMTHWQEVLKLDPKNAEALQALRGIYTAGGMWEELLSVLRKLVPLQEDMVGVKAIRFELAEILGEKLNRRDEAIDAAKRALDIEPHTPQDLDRMAAIFQANEAWQDAVTVLEQGADLKEADAEKIETLLEVASIWKDKIGRPLGAAPAYQKILELDPIHEEAFRAAEEIYRENKEWRRLTTLLEGRLVHIREKKDRVALINEIAEIYETHLGQKELAFARYCAAFREDFSEATVLVKLESLAEETEDYDTLLEVLEDATEEVTSGSAAVSLYSKIAGIYRARLGQTEKAEEWLQKAVELDKREVSSLDSLSELYRDQERWDDLIKVLETKYDRSDDLEERKDIRAQIALLQEERLERVDLAIESFRRIVELDGRDARAIQSLIRLYQQEERWLELIQVLRRAAEQAEEREVATNHLFNIASIYETELNTDEDAIEAYRSVIEEDPTHAESLKALERIYTRLDRWSELLQVFEKEVALIEEPPEKIKLYNKMGSIWEERFSNVENAAACHDSILELDDKNLQSVKALERLVRRMGDYKRLIELYYQHIDLVEDRQEIVDIHLHIGDVWYRELSRVDKAEDVYNAALKIDEQSRQAIHALGQLYEKSGNWFNAIEMLQKEAELCGATPEAVDLYYRMGKINEDMLLDSGAARGSYGKALSIDPSYLPAIKALKLIHYLDKEYDQYLEMMIQEAEHTEDVEEKTRLYYEIGKFLQEQRDDSAEASRYYEEAMRRTPDFLPAAKPLADIYFRTEQWEEAEKMMEIVVAGLDRNTEAKELCRQYYRLGYITEKLGKGEKALEHYRESYDLDATYLPALEGLGNALIKAEQWDEAYRIYQTILIHHRDSLSDAEVAELYWQIGDVNFHMGEIDRSIGSFKKALEIDDTHLASLQYLVRIYEEQEDWEEAYDYGMRMVDAMDEDDLFDHYVKLGTLCREKIQDPFRAVDSLQGALKLRPDSLDVMNSLLEVYIETSQHQKAVDILEQVVQVESRPRRLVEYHEQAGQLLRDEMHDDVRAVEHFNAAMDIDPSYVKAFQAVTEILSRRKDWLALKDNYINMIRRLPVDARKTKLALWKDLGELCRVVLRNLNESIDAYKMITTLDSSDVDALATLGDLLAAKQGAVGEAISTHHKVLSMSADRIKSYRTLWKLYNQKKEYDKVYAIATILRYLKKADDEEAKIVNYFSRKAPQVASRPVSDKVWESMLAHPGVKVPFTRIFSLLYRKAQPMFVKEHKELNLRRRDHMVDLARDRSLFAHNFRIAAKVLGGMEVELFALKDEDAPQPPGLEIVPTKPTALVAYRDMFREDKKKHLLFQIGRQLALARPEFVLNWFLKVKDLEDLLYAACQLVDPKFKPQAGDPRAVDAVRNRLKRALTDAGMGMLKRAVVDYLENPRAFSLRRWVEAVEHSVNRAGLIVSNDLSVTLGILKKESGWLTPMRPIQKVREMLVFASSEEYLSLREGVGLAVTQ
jgi:tetratricopeptide (TPR) repeat protein